MFFYKYRLIFRTKRLAKSYFSKYSWKNRRYNLNISIYLSSRSRHFAVRFSTISSAPRAASTYTLMLMYSFCIFFWRARVCWPLHCLCRPFCIFERCLDTNLESCRSKQARYQLSHPSPWGSHVFQVIRTRRSRSEGVKNFRNFRCNDHSVFHWSLAHM